MMSSLKKCRYKNCGDFHDSPYIDIETESYTWNGDRAYYHNDCYDAKIAEELEAEKLAESRKKFAEQKRQERDWKTDQEKEDLRIIIKLWHEHISPSEYNQNLYYILNGLLKDGYTSVYLVYVMKYLVKHRELHLNYPAGFKYYATNTDIRKRYESDYGVSANELVPIKLPVEEMLGNKFGEQKKKQKNMRPIKE